MRTLQRWALIALILTAALALGAGTERARADTDTSAATVQEQLWQARAILHSATFAARPTADGTEVRVTSSDPALAAAIRARFDAERTPLRTTLPETEVTAILLPDGAVLHFRCANPAWAESLRSQGALPAYQMLRTGIHELMLASGGPGQDYRNAWGGRSGQAPGSGPRSLVPRAGAPSGAGR
jgi:hypothetical protein